MSIRQSHALGRHSRCVIQNPFDWRLPTSFKQVDPASHVRLTPPLIRLSVSNTDIYTQEDHWIATFLPFSSSRQSFLQNDCSTGQHVPLNDIKHTLNTSTTIQHMCNSNTWYAHHWEPSSTKYTHNKFSQNNYNSPNVIYIYTILQLQIQSQFIWPNKLQTIEHNVHANYYVYNWLQYVQVIHKHFP